MEEIAWKVGLGLLIFLLIRASLNGIVKRAKVRQNFMKEYLAVLNSPEYKIKRKTT